MKIFARRNLCFLLIFITVVCAGGCGGGGDGALQSFVMEKGSRMTGRVFASAPVTDGEVRLTADGAVLAAAGEPTSSAGTYILDLSGVTIPAVRYGTLECSGGSISGDKSEIIFSAVVDLQSLNGVKSSHRHISYLSTIISEYIKENGGDYDAAKAFIVNALGLESAAGIENGNVVVRRYFSDSVFQEALAKNGVRTHEQFRAFVKNILSQYLLTKTPTRFAPLGIDSSTDEAYDPILDFAEKTEIKTLIEQFLKSVSHIAGSIFHYVNTAASVAKIVLKIVHDQGALQDYLENLRDIHHAADSMADEIFGQAEEIHEATEEIRNTIDSLEASLDVMIFASEMNVISPDVQRIISADAEFTAILSSDILPAYDAAVDAYAVSIDAGTASADAAAYAVTVVSDDAKTKAGNFLEKLKRSVGAGGYDIDQSLYDIHAEIIGSGVGSRGLLVGFTNILADKMRENIDASASDSSVERIEPYCYYLLLEGFYSYLLAIQSEGYILEENTLYDGGMTTPEQFTEAFSERMRLQSLEFLRCAAMLAMETANLKDSSVLYNRGGSGWSRLHAMGNAATIIDHNAVESCAGVGPDPGNTEYYQKYVGFLDRAYFYTALIQSRLESPTVPMGAAFVYMSTETPVKKMVEAANAGKLLCDKRAMSPIRLADGKYSAAVRSKQNFVNWLHVEEYGKDNLVGVFSDTMSIAFFAVYPTEEEKAAASDDVRRGYHVGAGIGKSLTLDDRNVKGWIYDPTTKVFTERAVTWNHYYMPDDYLLYASGDRYPSADRYLCDLTAKIDILTPPENIMDYLSEKPGMSQLRSAIDPDYSTGGPYNYEFNSDLGGFSFDDSVYGVSLPYPPDPPGSPPFLPLFLLEANQSHIRVVSDPNSHIKLDGGVDFLFDFDYTITLERDPGAQNVAYAYRAGVTKCPRPNDEEDISIGWDMEITTGDRVGWSDSAFAPSELTDGLHGCAWAENTGGWIRPSVTVRGSGDALVTNRPIEISTEIAYKYMAVRPFIR